LWGRISIEGIHPAHGEAGDAPPTHGATYATTNGVTERANWTMAEAA